ncbi:MAG: ABC transporter ATP-binding protein, partial [Bellilinea sp.]
MALNVENLTVYYQTLSGDVHALEHASFRLADGEIMGLAGESGCGKTTLGHSLIVLFPPMKYISGRVEVDGEEIPIWDSEKMNTYRFRRISLIPQYAMNAMNPIRKIGKMVGELLEARGVDYKDMLPELKRRLDLVALPHEVLNMYPIELSGGMKQRAVMAIATSLSPKVIVADEPTSALDVVVQRQVMQTLGRLQEGLGAAVVLIGHDMGLIAQFADTVGVMYAGRLVEIGPVAAMIGAPRHPYTRLLIDSLPGIDVKRRLTGIPGLPPPLVKLPT